MVWAEQYPAPVHWDSMLKARDKRENQMPSISADLGDEEYQKVMDDEANFECA